MGVYLSKRADYVKLYLALWLVAFMGLWVNFFLNFSEPFRVTTVSYFLVYLAVLIGAYFILAPLLKNRAITSERSKWLPYVPALLLLLHWLFQQMDLMFAPRRPRGPLFLQHPGRPAVRPFPVPGPGAPPAGGPAADHGCRFRGHEKHGPPVRCLRLPGPGPDQPGPDHPGRFRPDQDRRRAAAPGAITPAWACFPPAGWLVALLLNLVLLLVPICGWVLLQKLLGKATPKWDKLLRLPSRWLGALPLILIGLAVLAQPETFLPALVHHHGHFFVHFHFGQFPGRQPEPGCRGHRQAGGIVLFLSLPLFPQDRRFRQERPGSDRERERGHRLFLLLHQGFHLLRHPGLLDAAGRLSASEILRA